MCAKGEFGRIDFIRKWGGGENMEADELWTSKTSRIMFDRVESNW